MATYTEAFKSKMVQRLLGPRAVTQTQLSRRTGISQGTLSAWLLEAKAPGVKKERRVARANAAKKPKPPQGAEDRPAEDRLRVLMEVARLSEPEVGELLRREGLHAEALKEWRQSALEALRPEAKAPGRSGDAKRVKELERALLRKDRALAEAAALLMLQKKVQALWAVADDDTNPESDE